MIARGALTGLIAALLVAAPAAAEVHVTSPANAGAGSLRDTIAAAPPGETVVIDPGVNPALTAEIKVDKSLTIRGQGAGATTISGGGMTRIFNLGSVTPGIAVRIEALALADGRAPNGANGATEGPGPGGSPAGPGKPGEGGGAILNAANQLILAAAILTGNRAGNGGTGGGAPFGMFPPGFGGEGGDGGAVANSGTMTIVDSILSGNDAGTGGVPGIGSGFFFSGSGAAGDGGAIANTGTLAIVGTTLSGNEAASGNIGGESFGIGLTGMAGGNGGAIYSTGTLTVSASTLRDNLAGVGGPGGFGTTLSGGGGAGGSGGAIFAGGPLGVTNATFVGNAAGAGGVGAPGITISGFGGSGGNGGAIFGVGTIAGATLTGNAAGSGGPAGGAPAGKGPDGKGGAVSGNFTMRASVLSANAGTSANANCDGGVTDGGGNIAFPEVGGCPGFAVANPLLSPAGLAGNGGPTQTIALLPGSAAIDAVPAGSCLDAAGAALTADQRGVARPQGPACDAGAFEVEVPKIPPPPQVPDTLLKGKAKRTVRTRKKRAKVKLRFVSIPPGASFECKLDRGRFLPCKSPKAYRLKRGRHTIAVRAVLGGVVDPTPAKAVVKVKKRKKKQRRKQG